VADPVLGRAEIIGAIRIIKALDLAAGQAGTPEGDNARRVAERLARQHPRGRRMVYQGRRVLDVNGND
jgi:hypothetical protein